MGYAMAGLLQGLGKGVENLGKSIEERRAAALEAARKEASERRMMEQRQAERAEDREWKTQDMATEQTQSLERIDRQQTGAERVLTTKLAHDSTEAEADRAHQRALKGLDFSQTVTLENLRSKNRVREAKAIESFKPPEGMKVDRYVQDTDGNWKGLAIGTDGRVQALDTGVKGPPPVAAGAASADDPLGLNTPPPGKAGATPPRAGKPDPKYDNFRETVGYIQQQYPKASRDDVLRMSIEQARKYNLPITERHLKIAREKGWIK